MSQKVLSRWSCSFKPILVWLVFFVVVFGYVAMTLLPIDRVVAATIETINFQARLMSSSGAIAPDGDYNVEFKFYDTESSGGTAQGVCSGNCKWLETRINSDKVHIANGYLTVNLGSVDSFGSTISWDQELWITMNIGGTGGPSWDGEMSPRLKLTAVPYAFRAGQLAKLTGVNTSVLDFDTQTDAQSILLPDESGILCIQSASTCGFLLGSGTAFVQGGNTLGVAANIGTIDAFDLNLKRGNTTQLTVGNGLVTLASNVDLALQGSTAYLSNPQAQSNSESFGASSVVSGADALAVGNAASAAAGSTALGRDSIANGLDAIAIGAGSRAGYTNAVVLGVDAQATANNQLIVGGITSVYLGNGVTASSPNNVVLSVTSSDTTGVTGGAMILQGGNATVGSANGGNVTLTGGSGVGTGVRGLVVIDTPTLTTTSNDANCYTSGGLVASSCTITTSSVNNSAAVIVGFNQSAQSATLPDPTNNTAGRIIYITGANGSSDFTLSVNGGGTGNEIAMRANTSATMIWNGSDWTAAGASSSTTLQAAYNNTLTSAGGAEIVLNNTASSNGLTVRNNSISPIIGGGLLEVQTSIGTNLFSVNNNINELVSNGGAEDGSSFTANWTQFGTATITRNTTSGQYATGAAGAQLASTTTNSGIRNNLAVNPTTNTNYMISFTARLETGSPAFSDMRVDYSSNGGTTLVNCLQNQSVVSTSWTRFTCEVNTGVTAITNADILIYQVTDPGAPTRTVYIDNLSMTLADDAGGIPNNVQIGGGIYGGSPTLFTLDRSSAPPVANGNQTYLGSMYYDTVTGRIQCYESDGWGACGSAPDEIVALTPEYTGAVLNGSGIGTMTADFCSNDTDLQINTSFCASGISRNFYRWTSPQASEQIYSIYVSYKLPNTFKEFVDQDTIRLTALTDDIDDGEVTYQVFKSTGTAVQSCGTETLVTTPNEDTWYTKTFDGDETACDFTGGNNIIFKINVSSRNNASVYVENLDFTYLNL